MALINLRINMREMFEPMIADIIEENYGYE